MKTLMIMASLCVTAGCNVLDLGGNCTLISVPAMIVEVVDSTSGNPVPADVTVVFADGVFSDTVHLSRDDQGENRAAILDHDRPGSYTVAVLANGYARWVANEVGVGETGDGCHAETVNLTARLQRVDAS